MDSFIVIGFISTLVIFLAFEIRHREVTDSIETLTTISNKMYAEILELKEQMKMKKDVHEERNPPIY
ncbi:MAG: hypothetical protein JW788_06525 [Candidatus Omnitrophica bacterium]|nr:hypothetical protein [Candidatus Omnitrophota bacterium]